MAKSKTPPAASPLEAHLGFWLRFVSNHVSGRFEKLLADKAISITEWVALRALYQHPEVTHAELIGILGMTKGAASKIVTRLEHKALAERWVLAEDARGQTLRLTAKGRRLVPELAALADANDAFFFGHLPAAERRALLELMQALVRHHQMKAIPTE